MPAWARVWRDAQVDVRIDAGSLAITPSPLPHDYGGILGDVQYRSMRAAIEVVQIPAQVGVFLGVDRESTPQRLLRIGSDGETLVMYSDDLEYVMQDIPYDAVAHRYWQIREDGGEVLFETSPDNVTFTTWLVVPTPDWVDTAYLVVGAGGTNATTVPGDARIERIDHCRL